VVATAVAVATGAAETGAVPAAGGNPPTFKLVQHLSTRRH